MRGISAGLVYGVYYCIPHLEWYHDARELAIHGWGGIPWLYVAGATLYGALYTGFLLGLTWLLFRRKTLML
jgi:hypothetical protein